MNIWLAPIQSFYDMSFYQKLRHSSLGKAFGYLAYLAIIVTILFQLFLTTQMMPQANAFVEWFKMAMPTIAWTQSGISIREESPYQMFHPEYGNLIVFDVTKETISIDQMGDAFVYVTATKAYARRGQNEVRVYELTDPSLPIEPGQEPVLIGPAEVEQYYAMVKPWIYGILFVVLLPLFYIWKMIAAIFYSLIGMAINMSHSDRLSFSQIYTISLYAMTPATLIEAIKPFIPGLNVLPFGLLGNLIVTTVYLFLALRPAGSSDASSDQI